MNNYKEIDFDCGATIEECVNKLITYRNRGKFVFGVFNGHKLYSDKITIDSAYKQITGQSKKEFDNAIMRKKEEYKKQQIEHINNIPKLSLYWMEKGREILDKSKWENWDRIVPIRLNDIYKGEELGQCLEIINLLKNNEFSKATELINKQNHSGMSLNLLCSMINEFSEKGNKFTDLVR